MAENPYAAPSAPLDTMYEEEAPPLWNPNAAANWSLLFSPAFGAILHMKNWEALGETGKARNAMIWAIVSVLMMIVFGVLPVVSAGRGAVDTSGVRGIMFLLLIGWYFISARAQARLVKDRYGDSYPRRGWLLPIVVGIGAFFVFSFIVGAIAASQMSR